MTAKKKRGVGMWQYSVIQTNTLPLVHLHYSTYFVLEGSLLINLSITVSHTLPHSYTWSESYCRLSEICQKVVSVGSWVRQEVPISAGVLAGPPGQQVALKHSEKSVLWVIQQ
jgi:hypothetical protein